MIREIIAIIIIFILTILLNAFNLAIKRALHSPFKYKPYSVVNKFDTAFQQFERTDDGFKKALDRKDMLNEMNKTDDFNIIISLPWEKCFAPQKNIFERMIYGK